MTARMRRLRRGAGATLVVGLAAGALPPAAGAQVREVACEGRAADVAALQAAVDQSAPGDVVAVRGTCDVSAVPAAGGDRARPAAVAVVVGKGVTVRSADPSAPATVVGSGDEGGFAVLPGGAGARVEGLRFAQVARPVVVAGAAGVTVASNTFVVPPGPGSAVTAVAGPAWTLAHGAGGTGSTAVAAGAVEDLAVTGNRVSLAAGLPLAAGQVAAAVDVVQSGAGQVDGVAVTGNQVGMVGAPSSFGQAGVFVQGTAVRDVVVAGNDLAGGRTGVVLVGVDGFSVAGNDVATRLGPGATGEPGGGVVVSDSSRGTVTGNTVDVLADPGTEGADLGALGVVEDVLAGLGWPGAGPGPAGTDVEVAGNRVGTAGPVQRGIVVSGPSGATVHGNEVAASTAAALHVGAATGAGVPRLVAGAVLCGNVLDGEPDDPAEVSFALAPGSTGNNAPGGAGHGQLDCEVTVAPSPAIVRAGDDLAVSGTGFAGRPVAVEVADEDEASLAASTAAGPDGAYAVVVPAADLLALADGALTVRATAGDARFRLGSAPATVRKDVDADPSTGTVFVADGDGFTNTNEALAGVPVSWRAPSGRRVESASIWLAAADGTVPPECGPFTVAPDGDAPVSASCTLVLPDGPYTFNARWLATDGSTTAVASDGSVKDTVARPPVVVEPAEGAVVRAAPVVVAGTAEAGSRVTVRRLPDRTVLGTATAGPDGAWAAELALADGDWSVGAAIRDPAGNPSGSSPARSFTVDTGPPDTTPPGAPVVSSPADGALVPGLFHVQGTAEPEAEVEVTIGTASARAPVSAEGAWALGVGLPTGTHTISAVAVDQAGNRGPATAVTVEVDATLPTVAVTSPGPDQIVPPGQALVLAGTAGDDRAVAGVVVELFDAAGRQVHAAVAACTGCGSPAATWTADAPTLAPGVYVLKAVAVDLVGNRDEVLVRFVLARA